MMGMEREETLLNQVYNTKTNTTQPHLPSSRLPFLSQVHPHNSSAQLSSDHSTQQQNNQSQSDIYLFITFSYKSVNLS